MKPPVPASAWHARAVAHAERADGLTRTWRAGRESGGGHAVEDFLFTYYPTRPAALRRWHPGAGVVLGAAPPGSSADLGTAWAEVVGRRWYRTVDGPDGPGVALDVDAFFAERADTVRYVRALLAATAARKPLTGCFGLHEWAMVYRDHATGRDHRHPLPLRLGGDGTDAVVESHPLRCTHFDAYRFFTPEASGRNTTLTRESQLDTDQPGCLHAAMDVYKWSLKLGPLVPGDVLLDAFELAREIRYTDMQASPYDMSSYGLEPVAIETADGKAEYVRRQRDNAVRGNALRERLVAVCDAVLPEGARA
ncbi:3-methyladenine DNA glycosylase [Luteimicrobium subarcticum]|uniref:3-methyladenine DNA glycosylase n=1 Tax=Luteimicrobium subarcticum TaxID=620910 RepID=A0A2M8WQM9_9MICO|nr:3-methyladenine DNA glycosylase [Luteimicrobium subarcticum]PJI93238.1 hypothetical protein CLV34_1803 [Luteimicrobium subarcticum]